MTMPLPKPEVILTHESDLDGFLSGLLLQRLAKHLFGVEIPLQAYHYQAWKTRDLRERSAWVCDFSFEARLDKPDWVVIDHHPNGFEAAARAPHSRHHQVRRFALLRTVCGGGARHARTGQTRPLEQRLGLCSSKMILSL